MFSIEEAHLSSAPPPLVLDTAAWPGGSGSFSFRIIRPMLTCCYASYSYNYDVQQREQPFPISQSSMFVLFLTMISGIVLCQTLSISSNNQLLHHASIPVKTALSVSLGAPLIRDYNGLAVCTFTNKNPCFPH